MRTPDPDTVTVLRAITALALEDRPFSADDVRAWLAARGLIVHPNAVGNGFRLAREVGLVEEVGMQRSTRAAARGRRVLQYIRKGADHAPRGSQGTLGGEGGAGPTGPAQWGL